MSYIKNVYTGSLWALTIATLCFKNEWLQMRVNTGLIFGGLLLVLSIVLILLSQKKKITLNWITTIGSLIICTVIGLAVYGFSRMKVVPAALVREGINQTRIPFATINKVLLIVTFGGAIIILATELMNRKK